MRSQKHELILKSTDFWSVFGLIVWLLLSSAVPAQEEVFTSADEAFYLTISQAYDQQELGNLDEATRLMEQGLLDEDLSEEARSSGMRVLSWFYTEAGRHPEAISIYGDLIYGNEDHLDRAELLSLRADSWEAIGQSDLAQIDRRMADQYFRIAFEEQESPTSLLDLKHHWEHISTLLPEPLRSLENKWALAAIIYLLLGGLLFSANILAGWRQSVEGNGTWARLLGVAAYAATAQLLPLLALSAMTVNSKVGTDSIRQTGTAIIAFLYSAFWVTLSLRPTVRPIAGKDPLPLVNQPGFVERVEEIASQLRIRTPVVRQLDSGGGAMSIAAFAGGLPAPSIVVSDGVLFRLKDLERDAIVAHELGHIANRSLWAYPVVPTIAAVAAVLTSVRLPLLSAVLLGMSVQIALFRVVSRYFEFSSDRHAARAIGVAETITALDKTHVASPIGNKGWWSFLAYATATHPSLEERLSALKQLHSEDGELPISWSESAAQRRRRGARIAGLLWLATVVILVALPQTDATELATIPILLATVFGPYLLIQKAIRKDVRTEMKRRQNASQARSSNWGVLIVLVLSVLLLFYMDHSLAEFKATLVTMAALGLVIFFAIVLLGTVLSRRNPYIKMLQAQQRRDWNEAIRIGEANLKKWKGDPAPRTDLALIKWMAGRRDEAIADLAELRESFPKFKQSWLTAAILELSRGNYHVATKLALEAAEDLPDDMAPHVIAARCQRLLGDVDKLREQSEIVTKIDPGSSSAPALEMLVAMLEGHGSVAWQKLEETEKQAPGDPFVLLLRAEMEHRFGDEQKAREALSSAQRILAASPMSFLQPELEHVRKLIDPPAETLPSLNGPEPPSIH